MDEKYIVIRGRRNGSGKKVLIQELTTVESMSEVNPQMIENIKSKNDLNEIITLNLIT